MADHNTNSKTSLNAFCQRFTGQSMGKTDIIYKVTQYGDQYQATVTLNCLEGEEYAGELCSQPKDAEQSAAQIALTANLAKVEGHAVTKRKIAPGLGGPSSKFMRGDSGPIMMDDGPDLLLKNKLKEAVKQILERDLEDGDIIYDVLPYLGANQATVRMPNLPGILGKRSWVGEVSAYKRDTMLNAASQALDTLLNDSIYGQRIDLSLIPPAEARKEKKKQQKSSSSSSSVSKGMGMDSGMNVWSWMTNMMRSMKGMKGGKKGMNMMGAKGMDMKGMGMGMGMGMGGMGMGMGMPMKGMMGKGGYGAGGWVWVGPGGLDMSSMMGPGPCWGKGSGMTSSSGKGERRKRDYVGGADLPRERITETELTGQVLEWKGNYGWIQPTDPIDHPGASKNKGKLYLNQKDIADGKTPTKGDTVQYHVYCDPSGLGAEEVIIL